MPYPPSRKPRAQDERGAGHKRRVLVLARLRTLAARPSPRFVESPAPNEDHPTHISSMTHITSASRLTTTAPRRSRAPRLWRARTQHARKPTTSAPPSPNTVGSRDVECHGPTGQPRLSKTSESPWASAPSTRASAFHEHLSLVKDLQNEPRPVSLARTLRSSTVAASTLSAPLPPNLTTSTTQTPSTYTKAKGAAFACTHARMHDACCFRA
ncbi:hypothetical protein DFH06DRAFT_1346390 [Mycena polygramma]|nr:hypothetical protein DFH06DRAFT_1346390 [Mycena polygramma]